MAKQAKKTKKKGNAKSAASFNVKARDKRMMAQLKHVQTVIGKNAVRAIAAEYEATPCHSTGIPALDRSLNGGIAKGRITETFGTEGGGKTTLSLSTGVSAQKVGGIVHFVDAENKFDESILEILGIDRRAFQLVVPDSSEAVWAELNTWLPKAGPEDIVIVDSLAMMRSMSELDEDGSSVFGQRAKVNSLGINRIKNKIVETGCTVIIINQVRIKMGIVYGNPKTTPGGDELKYASGTRLEISPGKSYKEGERQIGHICKIHALKCNHAKPYQHIEVPLIYGLGFETTGAAQLFDDALACRVILKEGGEESRSHTYLYGDKKIVGQKNFIHQIKTNEALKKWLTDAVKLQTATS